MFERFTDEARAVIRKAQELVVGSHQDGVEPINLMLAMCYRGGQPVPDILIKNGLAKVLAAEPHYTKFDSPPRPFTPQSKRVLELSLRAALQLGHSYISPLHLLLAITRSDDAKAILIELGGDPAVVEHAALTALASSDPRPAPRQDEPADAELQVAVRGLPLLTVGGVPLSLALLTDLIRLTGGDQPRDPRLRSLAADAGIGRLRALNWMPSARVGFAGLLAADLPRDAAFIAPNTSVQELYDALRRSVDNQDVTRAEQWRLSRKRIHDSFWSDDRYGGRSIRLPDDLTIEDLDDDAVELLNDAAAAVTDQTVLLLEILGEETVATKPTLPLQVRHLISTLPQVSVRHRGLLSANTASSVHLQRQTPTHGAMGGVNGITRHGRLVNLLPSQLALPQDLFIARMAESELLYQLRHTDPETPPRNVTIVLDTTPPTFGPIETVLRVTAHVLITTLWAAERTPSLITVDQPGLVRRIEDRESLVGVWTSRTLQPAGLQEAVATARRIGEPVVVLTHHHAAHDLALKPSADLRLLTTHVLDDVPTKRRTGGVHIHLEPSPKPSAIVQAVQGLLWASAARI
jgi:hypothetical protein